MSTRRPVLVLDDPLAGERAVPNPRRENPYEGAASRQFNIRLLVPLHDRYSRIVRALADAGFDTTVTEVAHALFHEGPTELEDARALVRRWRAARHDGGDQR